MMSINAQRRRGTKAAALPQHSISNCPHGNITQRPANQHVHALPNAAVMAIDAMRRRGTKAAALPQHSIGCPQGNILPVDWLVRAWLG